MAKVGDWMDKTKKDGLGGGPGGEVAAGPWTVFTRLHPEKETTLFSPVYTTCTCLHLL